jgi:acetylornithine/succinyldiaminopimelate/putrescine aminotransferase
MIADEVLTGLGRTGRMWSVEHYDIVPDILVVGKNLSGGIEPCAGVAARDDILGDNPRATAGSTFAGTPAGCAAGLKTLEIYQRDHVVDHAAHLASLAQQRMHGWAEKYSIVSEVRCLGLLMGISFDHPDTEIDAIWVARTVRDQMLQKGVWAICNEESTLRMYPALNMDQEVFMQALDRVEEAIDTVNRGGKLVGDYPGMPSGVEGF